MLRFGPARLIDLVSEGVLDVAPGAGVRVVSSPPVVGAALLALDQLGVAADCKSRAREELDAAAGLPSPDPVGGSDG